MSGMVNTSESVINVVIANKPKMLTTCLTTDTGLDQRYVAKFRCS